MVEKWTNGFLNSYWTGHWASHSHNSSNFPRCFRVLCHFWHLQASFLCRCQERDLMCQVPDLYLPTVSGQGWPRVQGCWGQPEAGSGTNITSSLQGPPRPGVGPSAWTQSEPNTCQILQSPQALPHNGSLCLAGSIFGPFWDFPVTLSDSWIRSLTE